MDVLTGMRNGPRGGASAGGSSGMSPIMMAVMGLLAYKAVKSFTGSPAQPGSAPAASSGGLGDIFRNGLGGAVGAGGLGGMLSGGLGDLLKQFQGAGKGDVAKSWVSTGQNEEIEPEDLDEVLTPEQIKFLMARTGLSREQLMAGLAKELPGAVDELTPEGRVPTQEEMKRVV